MGESEKLREALRRIVNELGVPGPDYPAPVANAYDIAQEALGDTTATCPTCGSFDPAMCLLPGTPDCPDAFHSP